MKKHLLPLALLLAISLSRNTATTGDAKATQLIYDTDGHELSSHARYNILPAQKGTGSGGLRFHALSSLGKAFVIQAQSEADLGHPVVLRPLDGSSDGKIRLSTDTQIKFSMYNVRMDPLIWYVNESSSEPHHVTVPEYLHKPLGFVFRVERQVAAGAAKGYKLVWCAGATKPCRDLGLYKSEGKTWLATIRDSP